MGSLPKSVKMAASLLSLTIFVLFHQESLAQNPCQDMTVADCTLRPDNIIGTFPFPVAEICESSCVTADTCMFWRFFKNDTVTECLHLSTNYHQDCLTFAGPTLGDIVACTEVDLTTCSAYIKEECEYSGDRLEDFEPQPGQVASIAACQAWAMPLEGYGVHYFVFDGITEECMLYSTLQVRILHKRFIKLKTHCHRQQN